jgi:hypothetical protein
MHLKDAALVLGATMRLTRLVVTDDLGMWTIKWPAYRWAQRLDPEATTWRAKLTSGLDCPFCVGTWIGFGVISATVLTSPQHSLGRFWRFVMAGLTLNEVAAHLGARLGDVADNDEG